MRRTMIGGFGALALTVAGAAPALAGGVDAASAVVSFGDDKGEGGHDDGHDENGDDDGGDASGTGDGAGDENGDELPDTGADTTLVTLGGLGLAAAGGAAIAIRRRRSETV